MIELYFRIYYLIQNLKYENTEQFYSIYRFNIE